MKLTDTGHRAAAAVHAEVSAALDQVLSSLTRQEREQFGRAMASSLQHAEQHLPALVTEPQASEMFIAAGRLFVPELTSAAPELGRSNPRYV